MTPQTSPDNCGKKRFLTIFNFSGDHSLLSQEEDFLLVQEEDLLPVQLEDTLLAQDYYMTTILYGYYMATTWLLLGYANVMLM